MYGAEIAFSSASAPNVPSSALIASHAFPSYILTLMVYCQVGVVMRPWIVFVVLLAFSVAQAEVYTLYPDGTGDFPNIQAAITGSQNGDVIQLVDGTYSGPGNREIDFMGRAITLRSVSGDEEACIVHVAGRHGNMISEKGFLFQSGETNSTVVKDLTIRNADADGT